jgi:hypothetical protein
MTDTTFEIGSLLRPRALLIATASLVLLALTGCGGGAAPQAPTAPQAPADTPAAASGTFIGQVAPDEMLAIVVGEAGDARGLLYGPLRRTADGTRATYAEHTSEWFDGVTVSGDQLSGSSAGGFMISATLTADAVSGTVTSPDGQERSFEATPATGIAGLYDVVYNPADGSFNGSSATGAQLTGQAPTTAPDVTETVLTITPTEGPPEQVSVQFFPGENPEATQLGFIVSQTGEVRGGPRKSRAASGGTNFTCPLID